eukprot:TRINITY_DN4411_c0_g3_i1.p1 TRINITY_DN4411_c0_g3~~TRINITY_DN4411_c0_g3_i1.p1  ORF type:complete len:385 (-),score=71.38 TRINITY_DN4411_c0_g3_i1:76-1230(-)
MANDMPWILSDPFLLWRGLFYMALISSPIMIPLMYRAHVFDELPKSASEPTCYRFPLERDSIGSEDIVYDPVRDKYLIASCDHPGRLIHGKPHGLPGMYFMHIEEKSAMIDPITRLNAPNDTFCPHGVSLLLAEKYGQKASRQTPDILFVINHSDDGDYVEEYAVRGEKAERLHFLRRHSSPLFTSLSDVVGLSPGEFIVTNDHRTNHPIFQLFLDMLHITTADVIYCKHNNSTGELECKELIKSLHHPNGLNISPDHKQLYITETIDQRITAFYWRGANRTLVKRWSMEMGSFVDNLDVDHADGTLHVATHFRPFSLLAHILRPSRHAPSMIYRITPDGSSKTLVYSNEGEYISGVSVAASDSKNKQFVAGTHTARIVLICRY